jgi:DNA-binding HxlR family transcriptional regulator
VQRKSFEDVTCSVAQCLDVVGEWWSLLIVRDSFLGVTRFGDFQSRLGISRNILTQRLNHLVDNGVLKRVLTRTTRLAVSTGSQTRGGICGSW